VADYVLHDRALAQRGAELHERLRAMLIATMPRELPAAIASALMYETVSLIASVTDSEPEARALLRSMFDAAGAQLDLYGVGGPHP